MGRSQPLSANCSFQRCYCWRHFVRWLVKPKAQWEGGRHRFARRAIICYVFGLAVLLQAAPATLSLRWECVEFDSGCEQLGRIGQPLQIHWLCHVFRLCRPPLLWSSTQTETCILLGLRCLWHYMVAVEVLTVHIIVVVEVVIVVVVVVVVVIEPIGNTGSRAQRVRVPSLSRTSLYWAVVVV